MRALLVVNPSATTTSHRTTQVITSALAGEMKLEVAHTQSRGDATRLADQASVDGLDVLVVLGGDGTINEVVNGLLALGPGAGVPALAVLPGGHTNVLAHSLGLPADPVEATGVVLDALRSGRRRPIGLSRADERWFTFCAGLGLDAEVVTRVERQRASGRRSSGSRYVRAAVSEFFGTARRRPAPLTLQPLGGEAVPGVHVALVTNTAPWTYLGTRSVNPSPRASFDTGVDVFALTRLGVLPTLRHVRHMLSGSDTPPTGRGTLNWHDLPGLSIRAEHPLPFQVDGEPAGLRTSVTITAVPAALEVLV